MRKEAKYIFYLTGIGFLVVVAALPFFGRVVVRLPSLMALCGFTVY